MTNKPNLQKILDQPPPRVQGVKRNMSAATRRAREKEIIRRNGMVARITSKALSRLHHADHLELRHQAIALVSKQCGPLPGDE